MHRTKEVFLLSKQRDKKKKTYAEKKGIPLIEITYMDKKIEKTLAKKLEELSLF